MNRIAVLLVLLCLPVAGSAQQTIETLTIDQAVAFALKHNRLLLNEEIEVEKAADQVAAARTRRLPAFDLTVFQAQLLSPLDFEFRRGALGTYPNLGPIPSRDTDISRGRKPATLIFGRASQPLTQLPRINLGIRLQESRRELAESRLQAQRQTVINQTKRLCYGLLQKQSALAAAEETIALYRELDRVVGEYVVQQVALEADSLEVKARLVREEYEALTLRHALESQREQLNQLLGRDLRAEFKLSPVAESAFTEIDLPAAQSRALLQRAEVSEARLKLKQAEYDQRLKQSERWPEVSLNFVYGSPFGSEVLPKNVAAVGLLMKWEPFDWGRKKHELSEKTRAIAQARHAVQEAEARVLVEVNAQFRKLEEARALLKIVRLSQLSAGEKLRVVRNKYKYEAALYKDVLQTQAAVADTNHQYQQALLNYWTARADFEKAVGEN